jgi:hypothetical protein
MKFKKEQPSIDKVGGAVSSVFGVKSNSIKLSPVEY